MDNPVLTMTEITQETVPLSLIAVSVLGVIIIAIFFTGQKSKNLYKNKRTIDDKKDNSSFVLSVLLCMTITSVPFLYGSYKSDTVQVRQNFNNVEQQLQKTENVKEINFPQGFTLDSNEDNYTLLDFPKPSQIFDCDANTLNNDTAYGIITRKDGQKLKVEATVEVNENLRECSYIFDSLSVFEQKV